MGNWKSTLAKNKKTMAEGKQNKDSSEVLSGNTMLEAKSTQVKSLSRVLSMNTKLDEKGVVCTQAKQETGTEKEAFGTVSVRIEWRIKKFEDLVNSYKPGMSLCSEGVSSALDPSPIWKLLVYPNVQLPCSRRVSVYVCLEGPMVPYPGTLCASYQLYIAAKDHQYSSRTPIKSGTYQFGSDGNYGVRIHIDYYEHGYYNALKSALRDDSSLVLVAEVEYVSKPLLSKLSCIAFKLRESGGHSDCTPNFVDKEFKAHRAILSNLSTVSETMLQPCEEVTVHVKDYSVKAVKALLDFAYTGYVDWTVYDDCERETGIEEEAFSTAGLRSKWKIEGLMSEPLWLESFTYLSKAEVDNSRGVCKWVGGLIEKHSGRQLKQIRQLDGLIITPFALVNPDPQLTPLDMDKWKEDENEEEAHRIEIMAEQLTGKVIYPYEPENAMVRITIAEHWDRLVFVDVENRLDEKEALLIARLMLHITPPMAVFYQVILIFRNTPELEANAPYGGSYFNSAVFSLPSNANGSGGGPTKLITQYLSIRGENGTQPPEGMIRTAELTVQCQELYQPHLPFYFAQDLRVDAMAGSLNAPALMCALCMEDGRLDEMLKYFTHTVDSFGSTVSRLRVMIEKPATWPESLAKTSAINLGREDQLAMRLYKFQLHNNSSGENLEIDVHGSFANIEDEGKGEECLRVSEMVLHFRPDDADK